MIPPRLRAPLAASGAALLLLLGFPDSLGLWPLRLVSAWPGEIGRAVGSLLLTGRLGPLALSQATDFQIRGATPSQQALANALGLVAQLAAGLALFWLAEQGAPARTPELLRTPELRRTAELLRAPELRRTAELLAQFLAGAMVTAPLADLRPALLSIGRSSGPVVILESQSGIPALVWALLIVALVVTGLVILLRGKPGKVRAA